MVNADKLHAHNNVYKSLGGKWLSWYMYIKQTYQRLDSEVL